MATPNHGYDVSLSHSSADKPAVESWRAGIRGIALGPGFGSPSVVSPQAGTASASIPGGALTANQRQRLEGDLARLQIQYDTYTRRLAALDTDIGRASESL